MAAVARAKLERTIFRDSILNATRYTAPEGVKVPFALLARHASSSSALPHSSTIVCVWCVCALCARCVCGVSCAHCTAGGVH
jgi:hypothetical protein